MVNNPSEVIHSRQNNASMPAMSHLPCGCPAWSRLRQDLYRSHVQWRRNEFESGGGHPSGANVGEHRSGAERRQKSFRSSHSTFLALRVQLVVLVSVFVMVSKVWPVSCLLFVSSLCPPRPMESAPLLMCT